MVKPRVKTLKGNLQGLGNQPNLKTDRCLLALLLLGTWNAPYRMQSPWPATAHFQLPLYSTWGAGHLLNPVSRTAATQARLFVSSPAEKSKCYSQKLHARIATSMWHQEDTLDYIEEFISLSRSPKDIKTGPRQVTPGLALPVCPALNNAFCSFQILSSLSSVCRADMVISAFAKDEAETLSILFSQWFWAMKRQSCLIFKSLNPYASQVSGRFMYVPGSPEAQSRCFLFCVPLVINWIHYSGGR